MMPVGSLVQDPEFQALSSADQRNALARFDPEFGSLSDADLGKFMVRMNSNVAPAIPMIHPNLSPVGQLSGAPFESGTPSTFFREHPITSELFKGGAVPSVGPLELPIGTPELSPLIRGIGRMIGDSETRRAIVRAIPKGKDILAAFDAIRGAAPPEEPFAPSPVPFPKGKGVGGGGAPGTKGTQIFGLGGAPEPPAEAPFTPSVVPQPRGRGVGGGGVPSGRGRALIGMGGPKIEPLPGASASAPAVDTSTGQVLKPIGDKGEFRAPAPYKGATETLAAQAAAKDAAVAQRLYQAGVKPEDFSKLSDDAINAHLKALGKKPLGKGGSMGRSAEQGRADIQAALRKLWTP